MPKKKTDSPDFEKSLTQLTNLVEKMERGNLTLEESLKHFETGVGLIRECQQALTKAEQKIQILTKENNIDVLKPYHESRSDE